MKTRLLREKLKIWFWILLSLFCGFFVLFCFVVVIVVFLAGKG